jgi:heterodisulfide reductase subunit C
MALKCLDLVFGEGEKKDSRYVMKRANTIIISIGCNNIFPDCFCTSVGGNPFYFDHSDLGLIDMGPDLVIFKSSEKDDIRELLDKSHKFFEEREINSDEEIKIKKIISDSEVKCRSNNESVNAEDIVLDMENKFNDEEMWKNITRKCISCAACTYVCPTCVCFNIGDEQSGMKGERYKCWDFCTNYYYTLEASGHNPRENIYQRYRNKINCKYNYFYKRNKNLYCVGCGRCIDVCPVGMDIREIVKHVRSLQK